MKSAFLVIAIATLVVGGWVGYRATQHHQTRCTTYPSQKVGGGAFSYTTPSKTVCK